MIAGEHHALLLQKKTHVVIDVARGSDRPQRPIRARNGVIVLNLSGWLKGQILMTIIGRDPADQPSTRGLS